MKKPFFARHALLVLMVVFFLVPFAMRGSRYAVERMKNDVKDWLPSDFRETRELEWFSKRFLGEQFVVISWEDCYGTLEDERFRLFVDKLFPEVPPSQRTAEAGLTGTAAYADPRLNMYTRCRLPTEVTDLETFIGNRLRLSTDGEYFENWGGIHEKWLRAEKNQWVYLTPTGDLYQWTSNPAWPAALWREIRRAAGYPPPLKGEFLSALGDEDGPWYYHNPRRLTAHLIKTISTGPSLLSEMTRDTGNMRITDELARKRLSGVLFGPDGKQTAIVVTLTEAGKQDPRSIVGRGMLGKPRGFLLDIASESGIHPPPEPSMIPPAFAWLFPKPIPQKPPVLKLGGPPVDNAAIDEEGQITLVRLVGLSLAVGLGLSWLCFRSVNVTIMVFLVGGISALASVSLVYWTGSSVDAVLMSMPSLVYVLGISGAVHIVNYYRESVYKDGLRGASGKAIALGWQPCTLAAATTALGLLSLYTSQILPIRKFGFYSALGVMATLLLLFTYLPAALQIWPPRSFLKRGQRSREATRSAVDKFIEAFWMNIGQWIIRNYGLVCTGCVVVMVGVGAGLYRINTSIQLLKMFDTNAQIIQDYRWFENNLGKLVPMEVVVRVDRDLLQSTDQADPLPSEQAMKDSSLVAADAPLPIQDADPASIPAIQSLLQMSFLERMEIAEAVRVEIDRVFGEAGQQLVGRAMLANTFAPELPPATGSFRSTSIRGGMSRSLEENRPQFLATDYLRIDPEDNSELWRISLRLNALSDIDFGTFVQQIKMVIEPVMQAYHYRQQILTELARNDPDHSARGAKVFLAGLSQDAPTETNGKQRPTPNTTGNQAASIDQTKIMLGTLVRVLKAAGLGVYELPPESSSVTAQDCVVRLSDLPAGEAERLGRLPAVQIDARDHGFVVGGPTAADRQANVSAVYTGLVPIVYKAQRTLLQSLVGSTFWAFVMIGGVMMVVLRGVRAGAISMLPNVFPVLIIFGWMGWMNWAVDIGSMMTASVAMGVAVDDTIHFLTWFRRALDAGAERHRAILMAYRRVAMAMTQTTAIGGLGLSIFAFSTFTPTQRFGTLMLALLAMALVGDLIFLPALLASPLGRIFRPARSLPRADRGALLPRPHILQTQAGETQDVGTPAAASDERWD